MKKIAFCVGNRENKRTNTTCQGKSKNTEIEEAENEMAISDDKKFKKIKNRNTNSAYKLKVQ